MQFQRPNEGELLKQKAAQRYCRENVCNVCGGNFNYYSVLFCDKKYGNYPQRCQLCIRQNFKTKQEYEASLSA